MKKTLSLFTFLLFVFVFLLHSFTFSQFSATQATNQLANAMGVDIKGYKIYSIPSNNFGLGTSCIKKFDLSKGNVACDMIDCYGLAAFPESSEQWRTVNGIAYKGVSPGIQVTKDVARTYGISVIIPKILQILSIDLSLINNKTLNAEISIDTIMKRSLNYDKYIQHVTQSPQDQRLYKSYAKKDLVIAVADFVLIGYKVVLKPTDSLGISLSAKVDSLLKISPSFSFDKDSLGLGFSRKVDGTVTISSSEPVILGVSVVKQKKIQTEALLHTFTDDNGWEIVDPKNFPDPTAKKSVK